MKDTELINAFRNGNEQAFAQLMNRHAPAVKGFALRMLRHLEQAEEICAETFLRVAVSKGSWEHKASVKSYLFTVARNLCIDQMRRNQTIHRHHHNVVHWTAETQLSPSPESEAILGERASMLEQGIATLSPQHREIILLRGLHGMSAKETSDILGISAGKVHNAYAYAKQLLREELSSLASSLGQRMDGEG